MSNNSEGLKKCYMALEDNESLSKLFTTSPRVAKVLHIIITKVVGHTNYIFVSKNLI